MNPTCDVIIAAGGRGSRFGGGVNKLLLPLKGKEVLGHSVCLFAAHPAVRRLVLPCRGEEKARIEALARGWLKELSKQGISPLPELIVTEGGAERQASVYRALLCCREDRVLIHDGARPFAVRAMIEACLTALSDYPAVSVAVPSKDTVKIVNEKGEVIGTTDRDRTMLIQTPQGFWRKELLAAHEAYRDCPVTDDCRFMEMAGHPVKIVPGSYENIKITTPEDLP